MTRRLHVLGSTGSIGANALDVVDHLQRSGTARFEVVSLAAGCRAALLAEQADRFDVTHLAIADDAGRDALRRFTHVHTGPDAAAKVIRACARPGDLVVAAMVGAAGIPAVTEAIEAGCDVALANKETLVAAGAIVMPLARERGANVVPVDSEHSAVAQCLRSGRSLGEVQRVVLTASGGPFRTWSMEALASATVAQALDHPTWSMGEKVTVDSASMMNKALEVIEAHWLFGLPADRIEVVVHPSSIVHSFVEFVDGSVLAQLGPPDMRTPIQYALTWPERHPGCSRRLDFDTLRRLEFEPVDDARFPAVGLARRVIDDGGTAGAVFNAANEEAVRGFLKGRLAFLEIARTVEATLGDVPVRPVRTLADVEAAGIAAIQSVASRLGRPGRTVGGHSRTTGTARA